MRLWILTFVRMTGRVLADARPLICAFRGPVKIVSNLRATARDFAVLHPDRLSHSPPMQLRPRDSNHLSASAPARLERVAWRAHLPFKGYGSTLLDVTFDTLKGPYEP